MAVGGTVSSDLLRDRFAIALSEMYCDEVPAYAALVQLVGKQNEKSRKGTFRLNPFNEVKNGQAYHGAIRLGSVEELRMMRRAFSIMGMQAVGYYDLSEAGLPVHSTAFRPTSSEALEVNPFRVFTSLLRLDLLDDADLKHRIEQTLSKREVFTVRAVELIKMAETQGEFSDAQADEFVAELLETFRWKKEARVSLEDYKLFDHASRLVADIVSFQGPHINHLTVGAENIDAAHETIASCGVQAKYSIEGPPIRKCPILLRQTAFKAIQEPVFFPDGAGGYHAGSHTARFGEIEARGAALTPKGRALYDSLLAQAQAINDNEPASIKQFFSEFPDDWDELREKGLVYFQYRLTPQTAQLSHFSSRECDLEKLLTQGAVEAVPIRYEDFLPVSAAGIFRSNLGQVSPVHVQADSRKSAFETSLGAKVLDPFELYAAIESASISHCLEACMSRFFA